MKIMEETKEQSEWKSDGLSNIKYYVTKIFTDVLGTKWFKVSDISDISQQKMKKNEKNLYIIISYRRA